MIAVVIISILLIFPVNERKPTKFPLQLRHVERDIRMIINESKSWTETKKDVKQTEPKSQEIDIKQSQDRKDSQEKKMSSESEKSPQVTFSQAQDLLEDWGEVSDSDLAQCDLDLVKSENNSEDLWGEIDDSDSDLIKSENVGDLSENWGSELSDRELEKHMVNSVGKCCFFGLILIYLILIYFIIIKRSLKYSDNIFN